MIKLYNCITSSNDNYLIGLVRTSLVWYIGSLTSSENDVFKLLLRAEAFNYQIWKMENDQKFINSLWLVDYQFHGEGALDGRRPQHYYEISQKFSICKPLAFDRKNLWMRIFYTASSIWLAGLSSAVKNEQRFVLRICLGGGRSQRYSNCRGINSSPVPFYPSTPVMSSGDLNCAFFKWRVSWKTRFQL